jgi:hypothetical protein
MKDIRGMEEHLINILWYLSQYSVNMCWVAEDCALWLVEYVILLSTLRKTWCTCFQDDHVRSFSGSGPSRNTEQRQMVLYTYVRFFPRTVDSGCDMHWNVRYILLSGYIRRANRTWLKYLVRQTHCLKLLKIQDLWDITLFAL